VDGVTKACATTIEAHLALFTGRSIRRRRISYRPGNASRNGNRAMRPDAAARLRDPLAKPLRQRQGCAAQGVLWPGFEIAGRQIGRFARLLALFQLFGGIGMTASSMDRHWDTRPRRQDSSARGNALLTRSHTASCPERAKLGRVSPPRGGRHCVVVACSQGVAAGLTTVCTFGARRTMEIKERAPSSPTALDIFGAGQSGPVARHRHFCPRLISGRWCSDRQA
jgi:hypothetical protein